MSLHIKKHCAAKSTWLWPVCTALHCLQWPRPCQQFAAGTMSSFPLSPALPPFSSSSVYACISPYSSRFRGKELGSYPTKPRLVPRKGTEQGGTAMNCKGLVVHSTVCWETGSNKGEKSCLDRVWSSSEINSAGEK